MLRVFARLEHNVPVCRHTLTRRFGKYSTENFTNILDSSSKREIYGARLLAAIFLLGGTTAMVPFAATGLVEHTVRLMNTKDPFLSSSGINRLYYLTNLNATRAVALRSGAVEALLDILGTYSDLNNKGEQGRIFRVLSILERLSSSEDEYYEHVSKNDCSGALRKLLYALEGLQLEASQEEEIDLVAKNFQMTRSLHRNCVRYACK